MQKVLFFLNELSDRDVDWLIQVGQKREIPSGTVLIHEGQPVDTLYIMLDGTLVVSIAAMGERELAKLHSGEVVGEMSFIDARPPSATVKTLEKSLVLSIPRTELAQKLDQDESFAARFYRAMAIMLSHRLRGTVKQLGYSHDQKDTHPSNGTVQDSNSVSFSAIAEARFERFFQNS